MKQRLNIKKEKEKKMTKEKKKDGPGPVMVRDTLCPVVHILAT